MTSLAVKCQQMAIAVGFASHRLELEKKEAYHSALPYSNYGFNRAGTSRPVWTDRPRAYKIWHLPPEWNKRGKFAR